jgi:diguanylate cyclase (GGDEF)-like protein
MDKIIKKEIVNEAKKILDIKLTIDLIEVLLKIKKGNKEEISKLAKLKRKYNKKIYNQAVYVLSNNLIDNENEAFKICKEIKSHEKYLSTVLKRKIGIEVAALDYFRNIKKQINQVVPIEQNKIDKMAKAIVFDHKTKVTDIALLHSDLDEEIARTNRYGTTFSIIFIDIDYFKNLNDTFGHLAGDNILLFISKILKENTRKIDTVYRYGGDEFVILLPETNLNSALQTAIKCQKALNKEKFNETKSYISLSFGIASYGIFKINTKKKLLKAADKALYNSKKYGKGKISIYKGKNNFYIYNNKEFQLK